MSSENLFQLGSHTLFLNHLQAGSEAIQTLDEEHSHRVAPERYSREEFHELVEKYSRLPLHPAKDSIKEFKGAIGDLFIGIPRWKHGLQQSNVGTAVNAASSAAYALALDENVLNVNDGLAGNTLVAEQAVTRMMASLAGLPAKAPFGLFTFGGSATNLYGMKIGIRKALPESSQAGIYKRVQVFVSKEAHFSHQSAANWLGIGVDNVDSVASRSDHTINVTELEQKLRKALGKGTAVGAIILNGGTTYDHAIDSIDRVVALRDKLVKEFKLPYKPHIHVDSVIGWGWLMFSGYDWKKNPLDISAKTLEKLKNQYDKIKHVRLADSWGVDFHKGIGGCPVACSLVMINRREDVVLLARPSVGDAKHRMLAEEFSSISPVDYTLETSRPSGAPLAALLGLRTRGKRGYQQHLANLIEHTGHLRELLGKHEEIQVSNQKTDGFATLVRLLPPGMPKIRLKDELADASPQSRKLSDRISDYTTRFFAWSHENFIRKGDGPEYSFSSQYLTAPSGAELSALKVYPVSPHFSQSHAEETAEAIIARQHLFNQAVWEK